MPHPTTRAPATPAASEDLRRFAVLATEAWSFLNHSTDLWLAGLAAPSAIDALARRRLDTLVAHARRNSPFYRDLYRDLPPAPVPLEQLPVVAKAQLMARFDDWVTRPELTMDAVAEFTRDPGRIGQPYLGQYAIWTSSGATGTPGIFVQDAQALAVYEALFAVRSGVDARALLQSIATGARFAYAAAIEGHFPGVTMWRRAQIFNPWTAARTRAISVLQPVRGVCKELNEFDPKILTSYASELVALAEEQRHGRLALALKGIWSGGETLTERDRAGIAGAFGCPVIDDYGAAEFMSIAFDCGCNALHLNRDWAMLEAVDREGRPVPDGTASWTVLLTNLANFIQPVIRYDLGDSVTFLPDPCPCGSHLPAIRVDGRRDDTISLECSDGHLERVVPLALCTAIEERAGLFRFQVIEEGRNQLAVRVDPAEGDRAEAAARLERCLRAFCAELGAWNVLIRADTAAPQPSALSGKLRRVCSRQAIPAQPGASRH